MTADQYGQQYGRGPGQQYGQRGGQYGEQYGGPGGGQGGGQGGQRGGQYGEQYGGPGGGPGGQAEQEILVDQLVFRWDAANPSGSTGFGPVAWSCTPARADSLHRGVAGKLRVDGGEVPPGLVRLETKDQALLVRRTPGRDRGGRPGTLCHALLGPAAHLDVEACLGLYDWSWRGSDLDLTEVRGALPPVRLGTLLESSQDGQRALAHGLPRVAAPLTAATAELLRRPEHRYSLLHQGGEHDPYPILWGLYGMFRDLISWRWTFASHDRTDDSGTFRFVFVPSWPASGSHDARRSRIDLAQPGDDEAARIAQALVRSHLLRTGGDDGREWEVCKALHGAGHRHGGRTSGDGLLRVAREALVTLDRQSRTSRAPGTSRAQSDGRSGYEAAGADRGQGRVLADALIRAHGLQRLEDTSVMDMVQRAHDTALLAALRRNLPYPATTMLLEEIAYRFENWEAEPAAELCSTVLDGHFFLWGGSGPGGPGPGRFLPEAELRAHNAATLYEWAVRPLAREAGFGRRLERLLPELWADPDPAARAAVWQILELSPDSGLPETVWLAMVRAAAEGAAEAPPIGRTQEPAHRAGHTDRPPAAAPAGQGPPAAASPTQVSPTGAAPPGAVSPAGASPTGAPGTMGAPVAGSPAMGTPGMGSPAAGPPVGGMPSGWPRTDEPSASRPPNAAPSYEAPYAAPSYAAPYEAPSYEAPSYEAPSYETSGAASSYAAPYEALRAASYEAPSYETSHAAPSHAAPPYETPYAAPSYGTPSFGTPSYGAGPPAGPTPPEPPSAEPPSAGLPFGGARSDRPPGGQSSGPGVTDPGPAAPLRPIAAPSEPARDRFRSAASSFFRQDGRLWVLLCILIIIGAPVLIVALAVS